MLVYGFTPLGILSPVESNDVGSNDEVMDPDVEFNSADGQGDNANDDEEVEDSEEDEEVEEESSSDSEGDEAVEDTDLDIDSDNESVDEVEFETETETDTETEYETETESVDIKSVLDDYFSDYSFFGLRETDEVSSDTDLFPVYDTYEEFIESPIYVTRYENEVLDKLTFIQYALALIVALIFLLIFKKK